MSYTDISKIVKKSISYCRSICLNYLNEKIDCCSNSNSNNCQRLTNIPIKEETDVNLHPIHIDFITRKSNLKHQVCMSLEERCAIFMNFFKGKKITPYKLRKIYKEHRIRKNKIRYTKILSDIMKR